MQSKLLELIREAPITNEKICDWDQARQLTQKDYVNTKTDTVKLSSGHKLEIKYYRETQKQTNCLHTTSPSLRELKIGRRDGNEKDNKAIGFYNEKNNFATFFCIFLCLHCTTTTRKCLISLFTEEVHKRRRNFLSLSELGNGFQEFTFRRTHPHLTKLVTQSNRDED